MPTPNEAIGSQSRIIWKEEAEWALDPAGSDWSGLRFRPGAGLATEISDHVDDSIDPTRAVQHVRGGKKHPGGDIPVNFAPEGFNTFLRHCLGGEDDLSGSGPYTHVVKGAASWPTGGIALEVGFMQLSHYFTFLGSRINSFALEVPVDGLITATFGLLSREEVYDTETHDASVVIPRLQPFVSHEMKVYEADSLDELAVVVAAKLEVDNNAEEECDVATDRLRYDIPPGTRDVTGTLTLLFNSVALYNKFMNEDESRLRIKLTAANGYYNQFDLPTIKYVGGSPTPPVSSAGPIQVEYPFRSTYNDEEETEIIYTCYTSEAEI
jgi:hypothetical protein